MSPKLDSTTRTTVWHTRNTNLQLLSPGSWLLNMESRKVHWKFLKTGSKLNGVSHLFHISPVAPPSHHVRPVASVPSLGGRSRICSSPRRRRPRRAAPRPPPGGPPKPPRPAARRLGPEGAAGDGDGTCQITWVASEDFGGFRGWKTGSLVMLGPPFLIETCITAHRNQDQLIGKSHLCRAIHCTI